jgi:hypothetical protein
MTSYLYAVQDSEGREVVSAHVDVEKVTDVHAERENDEVRLMFEDVVVETGTTRADPGSLVLLRWPSDDKLSDPVRHTV